MKTADCLALWLEARSRFTGLLPSIQAADLSKRLGKAPNSVGFLIRHIGDVELLFSKNVFQFPQVQVTAKTVIAQKDTGEWTNLPALLDYIEFSADTLKRAIESIQDEEWSKEITTKEFGTKTLNQALGRIISHTAYHAGQLAILLKYGERDRQV